MNELSIEWADGRRYPIIIRSGLLHEAALWKKWLGDRRVLMVTNPKLREPYLAPIAAHLPPEQYAVLELPDGEIHKTIATVSMIWDRLMEEGMHRDSILLALGGGVVGDMAGFAAACFQRGMELIQVPTTLLAQVDSSVGGKTGCNHPLGKNMIGAFYQPRAVLIDPSTLRTLPPRELSAGLAEVIKYALINDLDFFMWLEKHMRDLLALDEKCLSDAIARSCMHKAKIVMQDEREQGQRALLNLGHTFGHALESLSHYQRWLHGEAVAIGLRVAAELSHMQCGLSEEDKQRIIALLRAANLPVSIPQDMSCDSILAAMHYDKKVMRGTLRLIMMKGIGKALILPAFSDEVMAAAITASQE